MRGFDYYQDAANEWRWRLKDGNHEIVADSGEGYKHESDCKKGAELFTALGVTAPERKVDKPSVTTSGDGSEYEYFVGEGGLWYWHFQAKNNKIIADGAEGYASEHNVKRAITNVRSLLKELGGNGGGMPPSSGGSPGGVHVPPVVKPTPGPANPPRVPGDRPVG